jgi:flagellin-like protein
MKGNKKAVSPVVATALLVLIVIILGIIILLWARGFIKEVVEKEIAGKTQTVENYCASMSLRGIINDDGSFGFSNIGNVPIYAFKLKLVEPGSSSVKRIPPGKKGTISPGFSTVLDSTDGVKSYKSYESVTVLPILLGKSKTDGGIKEFECPERYGFVI